MADAGIPIVEITMTVPGALDVITELAQAMPNLVVGAGTIFDMETARRCAFSRHRSKQSTTRFPSPVRR
jgi:2-dehydro-3-deoxyphosphogluconate aldolase/(4S)-4-hydroxy-2-oxoglutarate aldolase